MFFFFFSSRRRHTRSDRDWSSDVCSSDLTGGVVAVDVSAKVLPHPVHGDVYTLGECVPLEWSGSGADLHSRVLLYYGSFASLARLGDFDWREEAWETLTHELRDHPEWRAHVGALAPHR